MLYQISLIGPPSVGKTTIARRVRERAGYALVGVDDVFQTYVESGMAPGAAKVAVYLNLPGHRAVPVHEGRSVIVDGAGLDAQAMDLLVGIHPALAQRLSERGEELQRHILTLSAEPHILRQRDQSRGREGSDLERMERARREWIPVPAEYRDANGEVPVLRFPNNDEAEQAAVYRALEERLGVALA